MTTVKDDKGSLSLPPACRQTGLSGILILKRGMIPVPDNVGTGKPE
ncbi:MAG: hypothetical protein L0958_04520 [Candidatus Mariimomonas ferrooxydans]